METTPGLTQIPLASGGTVSACLYGESADAPLFLYAHGAGAGMQHPFIVRTATALAQHGVSVLTFNFSFTEQGRKAPDRAAALAGCWVDVLAFARRLASARIIIGGKSMGGRYASMGVADGTLEVAGLVYFGYPLHPAGKPDKLRRAHLPRITVPQLFMVGTRDALCDLTLLRQVTDPLSGVEVAVFEGGDHGFNVRKKDGVDQQALFARLAETAANFIARL